MFDSVPTIKEDQNSNSRSKKLRGLTQGAGLHLLPAMSDHITGDGEHIGYDDSEHSSSEEEESEHSSDKSGIEEHRQERDRETAQDIADNVLPNQPKKERVSNPTPYPSAHVMAKW